MKSLFFSLVCAALFYCVVATGLETTDDNFTDEDCVEYTVESESPWSVEVFWLFNQRFLPREDVFNITQAYLSLNHVKEKYVLETGFGFFDDTKVGKTTLRDRCYEIAAQWRSPEIKVFQGIRETYSVAKGTNRQFRSPKTAVGRGLTVASRTWPNLTDSGAQLLARYIILVTDGEANVAANDWDIQEEIHQLNSSMIVEKVCNKNCEPSLKNISEEIVGSRATLIVITSEHNVKYWSGLAKLTNGYVFAAEQLGKEKYRQIKEILGQVDVKFKEEKKLENGGSH